MKDETEDMIIDLLTDNQPVKKKVQGKAKGNRTELSLCKLLTKHFGEDFTRSLGSGNRWAQVSLSKSAKQAYTGDICVPEGFSWVIECKGGYEKDINLTNVCDGNIARLDEFIEQVTRDAEYCDRKPIILWKRNRKPWLAIYREKDLPHHWFIRQIWYGDWRIVSFDALLRSTTRKIWFDE